MPRKKPFSGKQKKIQLQQKRQKGVVDQKAEAQWKQASESGDKFEFPHCSKSTKEKGAYNPNRYRLDFLRETKEEIERRKLDAQTVAISEVPNVELEVSIEEVYKPGSELDMPKRPKWTYGMSKHKLEQTEEIYFQTYLNEIHQKFSEMTLSYFEHNLETWRQAWRVLEMSDIIVMVTDVRHPVLHFSPALYDYVVCELKKKLILVLNKIDLVPASIVAAWTSYFQELFPCLHVVWFSSFPQDIRTVDLRKVLQKRRKPKKRVYNTQIGPKELFKVCQEICAEKVDLKSWETKIMKDMEKLGFASRDSSPAHQSEKGDGNHARKLPYSDYDNPSLPGANTERPAIYSQNEQFQDGILTIGFVGHPNVGKSSLMNGLIGHKVVSTSVTPGHTKYFQTYFLTKTVKLCDCPGLVFPSLIPKQLQILSGIYPISQVQEPYTPVGYLASHIRLVDLLKLQHPSKSDAASDEQLEWTAWDICEAYANKRNYKTAKAARPDVYRAANSILRMAVDGRLCLFVRPPGYTENQDRWENHDNTVGLLSLQATGYFRGALSSGEGRHVLSPADCAEDNYSSGSITDSNSVADLSEDLHSDSDGSDVVSFECEKVNATNQFSALSIDDESSG
ncbi:unnamed protein product [Clavelina lepadiformis]|uniref:Guanine nucleotide-binding protein-like 1 n=1 Tax=Clavelina lepadiformis TaxID=159417 RepID=A0ABP0FAK6_CLALP